MDNVFFLDGHSSKDYGITLQRAVSFSEPVEDVEIISIPGRNGDLHISSGRYQNITGTASCYALQKDVQNALEDVANWLSFPTGYRRLEVSDDPSCYRMARISQGIPREIRAGIIAPFEIVFDCDPRRFLLSGEYPVTVTESRFSIENFTSQTALPLITVYGSAPGTLSINGVSMVVKQLTDYIMLDCETQNAYRQDDDGIIENLNYAVNAHIYPSLMPGENIIIFSGGIQKIEILPRWWTL